jgi:hypothetical protein
MGARFRPPFSGFIGLRENGEIRDIVWGIIGNNYGL